jgi:hypothetical protein
MSFENIKEYLESQYTFVKGAEKNYYCDKEDKIVATINDEIITLYIDDPQDELESQYQKCALSILNNPLMEEATLMQIKRLIGEYNDTTIADGVLTLSYNDELDRISSIIDKQKDSQRNLGSVGNIILEEGRIAFSLNKKENKKQKIRKPIMIKRPKGLRKRYC